MTLTDYLLEKHQLFPRIPILDKAYFAMKGFGLSYRDPDAGRPKFHIADATGLFSVVPLMPSPRAPFPADDQDQLRDIAAGLGLRVRFYPRVRSKLSYFYLRSSADDIQTLESENILNMNFNPQCSGCDFCSRGNDGYASTDLPSLTPDEGLALLDDADIAFCDLSEIAIVTGMFASEADLVEHLLAVHRLALRRGFHGRLFYLGCQLFTRGHVLTILDAVRSSGCTFRYAFTVEHFSGGGRMHRHKTIPVTSVLETLAILKDAGVSDLQFTYMPGLDPLDAFLSLAPSFTTVAKPHMSIFRPTSSEQETLRSPDFCEDPVTYLCAMRSSVENLWNGPVCGNNLGNLWPFPLSRIHPKFSAFSGN